MSTTDEVRITLCKHLQEYGENVTLSPEVSLEHFDQCFTPERRLKVWQWLRESQEVASRCRWDDHDALLIQLHWSHERIVEMGRELAGKPRGKAARAAYRARSRRRTRSRR